MPPKKRSRAAATTDAADDSPPPKRQTKAKKEKAAADAADDAVPNQAVPSSDAVLLDSPPPAAKKQPKPRKGKAKAVQPVVIDDEDDDAAVQVTDPVALDSPPPAKKQSKSRKTKAPAVLADDSEDDGDQIKSALAKALSTDTAVDAKSAPSTSTSKHVQVPVDEGVSGFSHKVYINPADGVIYDVTLNQTNASNNNNKFYRIQLLEGVKGAYATWTRWGRIGERGQSAMLGSGNFPDALRNFEKKFKDKSGLAWKDRTAAPKAGKYTYLEMSYEADSEDDQTQAKAGASQPARRKNSPAKCTLEQPVRSLMELIFNQKFFDAAMASLNYDANKLPLGKLSKATILRGFQALKDLAALLDNASLAANYGETAPAATEHLSNLYYSLIPHAFGRNRPPVISSKDMLKMEIELLESLSDLKDADNIIKSEDVGNDTIHPLDSRFKGLGMSEMTALNPNGTEFAEISQYLLRTCGQTHDVQYAVKDIFRIERQGETDRFQNSPYANVASDRRLLWHGSRTTNYGGILSQGLRIAPPEAPVSGYMFDKGIYLADMSSKSANYCYSYVSGGEALLLLCEAELGQPMQILQHHRYDAAATAKQQGMISTWGQGTTGPKGWKDAKCVHRSLAGVMMPDTTKEPGRTDITNASLMYNEYICYDVAQVRLRYLLRVRM